MNSADSLKHRHPLILTLPGLALRRQVRSQLREAFHHRHRPIMPREAVGGEVLADLIKAGAADSQPFTLRSSRQKVEEATTTLPQPTPSPVSDDERVRLVSLDEDRGTLHQPSRLGRSLVRQTEVNQTFSILEDGVAESSGGGSDAERPVNRPHAAWS